MEILNFKAGDGVPEYVYRLGEGSARLKYFRFEVDSVVVRYPNGECEVYPQEALPEDKCVIFANGCDDGQVILVGAPTTVFRTPFSLSRHNEAPHKRG